jgi:hypothetical protein
VFALSFICFVLLVVLGDLGNNMGKLKNMASKVVGYMFLSELMVVSIVFLLFNVF